MKSASVLRASARPVSRGAVDGELDVVVSHRALLLGLGRGRARRGARRRACGTRPTRGRRPTGSVSRDRELRDLARSPSPGVDPFSAASASRPRTGVGAMPRNEIAERCTAPASSSSTAATTPVSAKSPLRRATSSTAKPVRPAHTGKCTAASSSSSPIVVVHVPTKKSAAGLAPGAARPDDLELGVERERHSGELGRRVGVRDRPAHGATVADLEVADVRDGLGEQRHGLDLRRRARPPPAASSP